jgi:hypothetical protein
MRSIFHANITFPITQGLTGPPLHSPPTDLLHATAHMIRKFASESFRIDESLIRVT